MGTVGSSLSSLGRLDQVLVDKASYAVLCKASYSMLDQVLEDKASYAGRLRISEEGAKSTVYAIVLFNLVVTTSYPSALFFTSCTNIKQKKYTSRKAVISSIRERLCRQW